MFSLEDYQKRYERLKQMSLTLDPDPVIMGLTSLTAKLSEVQELRNRVGVAMAEAIQNSSEVEIENKTIRNQLDTQMYSLMISDEYVKGQKTDKLREAAAQTKVPELVVQMHHKDVDLIRAEAYGKFVKQIHDNLEAANSNLSRQISVIQMSIQLGEIDPSLLPTSVTLKNAR